MTLIWSGKPEPEYNGRTISEWAKIYDHYDPDAPYDSLMRQEAVEAAHQTRDKLLPFALKEVSYEMPAWRKVIAQKMVQMNLDRFCPRIYRLIDDGPGPYSSVYFEMLGSDANIAVPDLTRIMKQAKSSGARLREMSALACIGTNGLQPLMEVLADPKCPYRPLAMIAIGLERKHVTAIDTVVPLLLKSLQDSDRHVSHAAAIVLGELALEPDIVVPGLTNCLHSTDNYLRLAATDALAKFGDKGRTAVPALIGALGDPNDSVRKSATNALANIAPEVLATNGL
jgi:hypothetical protein